MRRGLIQHKSELLFVLSDGAERRAGSFDISDTGSGRYETKIGQANGVGGNRTIAAGSIDDGQRALPALEQVDEALKLEVIQDELNPGFADRPARSPVGYGALTININEEYAFPILHRRTGEADGERGLAGAAFLSSKRDDVHPSTLLMALAAGSGEARLPHRPHSRTIRHAGQSSR